MCVCVSVCMFVLVELVKLREAATVVAGAAVAVAVAAVKLSNFQIA